MAQNSSSKMKNKINGVNSRFAPISISDTSAHANLVLLNHKGILIMGPSGSGKSSLSYQLVQQGASLIADDLVLLEQDPVSKKLLGRAHPNQQLSTGLIPINILAYFSLKPEHFLLTLIPIHYALPHFQLITQRTLADLIHLTQS